ncbi:MAG: class I SAM-dependent methyltransferase, partial [bacterium]|nr:class I SAM-dependent methyltransferase [bacterium]
NGYLLWYLQEEIPGIHLFSCEMNPRKAQRLRRTADGAGCAIDAVCADGMELPFKDNSFDAVSMLEVLEHTTNPRLTVSEACRVSRKWIVASVPDKADDNPDHLHLFHKDQLKQMFADSGVEVKDKDFETGVPNHFCWLSSKN